MSATIEGRDVSDNILDITYTLERLYERCGELNVEMKHIASDGNDINLRLLINMDKANDLIFNLSYINPEACIVKEKSGNIEKPYIIERIDDRNLLVRAFDVSFRATDSQYEALIDYINSKRIPRAELSKIDTRANENADNLCDTVSDILVELKSINKKLNRIVGNEGTSLDDVQNSIADISRQLDNYKNYREYPVYSRMDECTFENFIVGESNKFAHAAALAVSESMHNSKYNPLFIYGKSGLGKTHLLYAIRNFVIKKFPKSKVVYRAGDDFIIELVTSTREDKRDELHQIYRDVDVLLIDDIQSIKGRIGTQCEFLEIFNMLYESGKQVVFTSDRSLNNFPQMEERLRARFESSLIADIQPPNEDLRIAIIKQKAEHIGVFIPDDVIVTIAAEMNSNIFQLEGAVKMFAANIHLEEKADYIKDTKNSLADGLASDDMWETLSQSMTSFENKIEEFLKMLKHKASNVVSEEMIVPPVDIELPIKITINDIKSGCLEDDGLDVFVVFFEARNSTTKKYNLSISNIFALGKNGKACEFYDLLKGFASQYTVLEENSLNKVGIIFSCEKFGGIDNCESIEMSIVITDEDEYEKTGANKNSQSYYVLWFDTESRALSRCKMDDYDDACVACHSTKRGYERTVIFDD